MSERYLEVNLHTIDDKAKISALSRENPELVIDYFPPIGTGGGYSSLELLLASLASCLNTTVLTLLRAKMKRNVSGITSVAKGETREEHPRVFSRIALELAVESEDASDGDVERAIAVSEEKLCPVWAMLKGNVEISVSFTIKKAE